MYAQGGLGVGDFPFLSDSPEERAILRGEYPEDALRRAWGDLGAAMLAEWVARFPGSRPAAWWRFEVSEPRRPGYGDLGRRIATRETEAEYLDRLGLWLPGEREAAMVRACPTCGAVPGWTGECPRGCRQASTSEGRN